MEQRQMLYCDPKETINGFNLSFCKALLAKLEELHSEGRVIDESQHFTRVGASVLNYLAEQLKCNTFNMVADGGFASVDEIEEIPIFIKDAKEFISIFDEGKPSKIIGGIDLAFGERLLEKLREMQLIPYETRTGTYIELSGAAAVYLNHITEQILKYPTNYKVGSSINKLDYDLIVIGAKDFLATFNEHEE